MLVIIKHIAKVVADFAVYLLIPGIGPQTRTGQLNNPATLYSVYYQEQLLGMNVLEKIIRIFDETIDELLDTLQSEAPALTRQQQEVLFQHVWDDYPELTTKRDRMKAVKEDPYFNALQIKYAYAVTCHKAQGGQWERVFVDQGYLTEDMLSPDYFRWLYTALTRATDRVYLVNWPRQELDSESQQLMDD